MLAAVDEKVDEGYLTSWLIDYWVVCFSLHSFE